MIGQRFWTVGPVVHCSDGKWGIKLGYYDNGFCDQDSVEGELRCRYMVDDLSHGLDVLIADALRLGIEFRSDISVGLYYEGDGENPDYPPPADWEATIAREWKRLHEAGYLSPVPAYVQVAAA